MSTLASRVDPRPGNARLFTSIALLAGLSIAVQVVRDRGWEPYEPATQVLWLQSGAIVKRAAFGFDNLVADVYWMRAVVYYGGKRRADEAHRNFDLLYPILDLVTTLDPRFKIAYRFGAIFLTEAYPNGPGRPDLAVALLERGIDSTESNWEYMEDLGFVHYWWLQDYTAAAGWFERAGQRPGAPTWLAPLAATTLARGGDRRSSRMLWQQLHESTTDPWLKRNSETRLQQLDAMDMLDQLNAGVDRFSAREGRPPSDWRDLVTGEGLRGIPLDPSGAPFVLDPVTGRIGVSRRSPLWPLPTDTQALLAGPRR